MRTRHTKEAILNLEQQKKQARDLLRAHSGWKRGRVRPAAAPPCALGGLDEVAVRQLVSLHDAQFVLAREQGFASWPKLKAYAEPSSRSRHTRLFVADVAWMTDRVHGLLRTRDSAGPAALEQIREWHPRFSDRTRRGDSASSLHRRGCPVGLRQGARLRNLGRPGKPGEPARRRTPPRPTPNRSWLPSPRCSPAILPASKHCCARIPAWPASAGQMATLC